VELSLGNASLIPVDIVRSLVAATDADTATVYLSNPAAPNTRASYVLLACAGVDADHALKMWGPLPPASLREFSAVDTKKRRIVPGGADQPAIAGSRFARDNGIRSLVRQSIRLPPLAGAAAAEPIRVPAIMPPFVEVFLSYRTTRSEAELAAAADTAQKLLLTRASEIIECEAIRPLIDPHQVAMRHRRLQRVEQRCDRLVETSLRRHAGRRRARAEVADCFAALVQFLRRELFAAETGDAGTVEHSIAIYAVERWGGHEGDGDMSLVDIHPVFTTDNLPLDELHGKLRSHANPGICRYVAAHGTSVLLPDSAAPPPSFGQIFIEGFVRGPNVTWPLYRGESVFAVVNVEFGPGVDYRGRLQRIWQVLHVIERVVAAALQFSAEIDTADSLAITKAFSSFVHGPRARAIQGRVDYVGKCLGLPACSLAIFTDADSIELASAPSSKALGAFADRHLVRLRPVLGDLAAVADGEKRIWRLCPGGDGRTTRLYSYRFRPRELLERSVSRHTEVGKLELEVSNALRDWGRALGLQPSAATDLVLIAIRLMGEASADRRRYAVLILTSTDGKVTFDRRQVERFMDLRDALSSSLDAIESREVQATLFSWATAGIGSLHDVVNALGLAAEQLQNEPGQDTIEQVADLLVALRNQVSLLDGLSRSEGPVGHHSETVQLDAFVRQIVYESSLLAGHSDAGVTVTVAPDTGPLRVGKAQKERFRSVLRNVIANAFKYGSGAPPRVQASVVRGQLTIAVHNVAYREVFEKPLMAAADIVARVNAHKAADVLFGIIRGRRSVEKLPGIGVWLTARIVKEVLRGRFTIAYQDTVDGPDLIEVECGAVFPLQSPRRRPRRAAPAKEAGHDGAAS
jgi:signal transduction histidine kinase